MIDALKKTLVERTKSEPVVCKTAIVRQLLKEIDAATDAGHTYVQIAEWLKPKGLDISGKHLAVIVSQIRKKKKPKTSQPSLFDGPKKFKHSAIEKGEGLI